MRDADVSFLVVTVRSGRRRLESSWVNGAGSIAEASRLIGEDGVEAIAVERVIPGEPNLVTWSWMRATEDVTGA